MRKAIIVVASTMIVCLLGTVIGKATTTQHLTDSEMIKIIGGGCRRCVECMEPTSACPSYTSEYCGVPGHVGCNSRFTQIIYDLCREDYGPLNGYCHAAVENTCYYYYDCYCMPTGSGYECKTDYSYAWPERYIFSQLPCPY